MIITISLFETGVRRDEPKTMQVDLCEAHEVASERWPFYPVTVDGAPYLVALDDLCALGHAAELRRELQKKKP